MTTPETLVPGAVLGFREFRIDAEGRLLPLFAGDRAWESTTTRARCATHPAHRPPVIECTCGLHAWHHADDALVRTGAGTVVAAVRAHGRIVLGAHGFRAERAEVEAICLPGRWPARQREEVGALLRATHPEATVLTSAREFRRRFPSEDLSALGVVAERTSRARRHRRFGVAWVLGVIALYSVIVSPSAAGAVLGAGGWVILLAAFVGWQGWLVWQATEHDA